jgi:hypothetical protein
VTSLKDLQEEMYLKTLRLFEELPADKCKGLLCKVIKHYPNFLNKLADHEQINIKGFRHEKIPNNIELRKKICKALIKPECKTFLGFILHKYFIGLKTKYNTTFCAKTSDPPRISPNKAAAILDEISESYPNDPLFELYRTSLPWVMEKWFISEDSAESIKIHEMMEEFDGLEADLEKRLAEARNFQPCDVVSLVDCVKQMSASSANLRKHLENKASSLDLDLEEWSTKDEFLQEADRIFAKAATANEQAEETKNFFGDLLATMQSAKITHRSPKKMGSIQTTIEASCKEIEHTIETALIGKPEGAKASAYAWLEWLFTLENTDFLRLQKEISAFSKSLADLMEESWNDLQFESVTTQPIEPSKVVTQSNSRQQEAAISISAGSTSKESINTCPETEEETLKKESPIETLSPSEITNHATNNTPAISTTKGEKEDSLTDLSSGDQTIKEPVPKETKVKALEYHASKEDLQPYEINSFDDCMAALLNQKRYGLAYQLVNAAESDALPYGNPALYKALALSSSIISQQSRTVPDYTDALPKLLKDTSSGPTIIDSTLLAFAALLQPALLAPYSTNAHLALRNLAINDGSLNELKQFILKLGGQSISLKVLRGNFKEADGNKYYGNIRTECERFLQTKQSATTNYARATFVLHSWFSEKNPLGKAFLTVLENNLQDLDEVKKVIQEWGDNNRIGKLIDKTSKTLPGMPSRKILIEGSPRRALVREALHATDLLSQWVNQCSEQLESSTFSGEDIDAIRGNMRKLLDNTVKSLLPVENETRISQLSKQVLLAQLKELSNLLYTKNSAPPSCSPSQILGRDLLYFPNVSFDSNFNIMTSSKGAIADSILKNYPTLIKSLSNIFDERTALGDHIATNLIIDLMSADGFSSTDISAFEKQRNNDIRNRQQSFKALLDSLNDKKNRFLAEGLFNEEEFHKIEMDIEGQNPESLLNFGAAKDNLLSMEKEMEKNREKKLQDRLKQTENEDFPENAKIKIRSLLQAGDLLLANEYSENYKNKDDYQPESDDPLILPVEIFEQALFNDRIKDTGIRTISNAIKSGKAIGPFDYRNVRGAQRDTAYKLLEAWQSLKEQSLTNKKNTSHSTIKENLSSFFQNLGFEGVEIEEPKLSTQRLETSLISTPIMDREICPLPEYGSNANGYYKVLGFWGRPTEDDVLGAANDIARSQATIILWFGQLSRSQRHGAIRECRRRNLTAIIIDEYALLQACTARQSRLSLLFKITLPYTVGHPYSEVASLVPQEMFFGREDEINQIIDPRGGNLVYGGRQLGKTALLREIERTYHNPKSGTIVRFADLKHPYGIGEQTDIKDIWKVMAELLAKDGIIKSDIRNPDTVKQGICSWLNKNPNSRIVILFDEADNFLLLDDNQNNFGHIAHFKDLMDRTNRKFKVVFAGLHNVQRTSRRVNQSLAQFGSPISIGPLVDNYGQAAKNMVRYPFEALGFKFKNFDVVLRILAYTNYYPCLIQLFCRYLLKHLCESNTTAPNHSKPPYIIEKNTIEWLYQKDSRLREDIIERFRWTLKLDPRYRIIGLIIAMNARERMSQGLPPIGLSISKIYDSAELYWPRGHEDTLSLQRITFVVNEMCELGVLQLLTNDRYGLRNPNLLRLLGSMETMENELIEVAEMEIPEYEPERSRRGISVDKSLSVPSVLTRSQESIIFKEKHGIVFLSTPPIGDPSHISPSLKLTAKEYNASYTLINEPAATNSFNQYLIDIDSKLKKYKDCPAHIVFIGPLSLWNLNWVNQCLKIMERKVSSKRNFLRFVFHTDPSMVPVLSQNLPSWQQNNKVESLLMSIEPWHKNTVESWVEQIKAAHNCDTKLLSEETGNWGGLLRKIGRLVKSGKDWKKAVEETNAEFTQGSILDNYFCVPKEFQPLVTGMVELAEPMAENDFKVLDYCTSKCDSENLIHQFLDWGKLCGYLKKSNGKYTLTKPLPSLIKAFNSQQNS